MVLKREIGLYTGIFIVIADVIGTGIFITTGSILGMTGNALTVLILWGVGGLVAITGSLSYAELAVMWPEDGGEYVYLKKTFGLLPAFLTGWISLIVGFTVSVAITSIAFITYIEKCFPGGIFSDNFMQKILASGLILIFGFIHIRGVKTGSSLQNWLTILKLLLVFLLIVFGLSFADWSQSERLIADYSSSKSFSILDYGFPLLIIMFAYSGWNGASYIAGEIKNPDKNLPKVMFYGILIITIFYLLLNVIYLISTPGLELMGKSAVGAVATQNLFGSNFSFVFNIGIAIILLSSVSVQMMIGPRVYYAMANDKVIFHKLSRINPKFNTPDFAIIVQIIISIFYIFIGRDSMMTLLGYMGFSLGIFPLLSIIGLIILRYKKPEIKRPFKVPFFPFIPLIYITLTLGMMIASLLTWTKTSLVAIGVVGVGAIVFFIWQKYANNIWDLKTKNISHTESLIRVMITVALLIHLPRLESFTFEYIVVLIISHYMMLTVFKGHCFINQMVKEKKSKL